MKRVLLLGDSIRMGYDEYVKELLAGEFEVIYDDADNGRFSAYTLWQANQFFKNYGHFDVVHWNNGYWDMNIEQPMTEAFHPVDEYVRFLGRILAEIRNNGAVPVFATTVPILSKEAAKDVVCDGVTPFDYNNEWVQKYNAAAEEFMRKEGVMINDLYSLCLEDPHYYKCPDLLHLTEEGYRRCAEKTAQVIRQAANGGARETPLYKDIPEGLTLTPGQKLYSVVGEPFDLYGVFYDQERGRFLRMPQSTADSVNPTVAQLNAYTAGGRIRFSTDANRMSVTVSYDALNYNSHMSVLGSGGFILLEEKEEADGRLSYKMSAHFIPGHYANASESSTPYGYSVEKYLPGTGMRNYVLYMPTYNDVKELIIGLPEDALCSHGLKYRRDVKPVLYYGSSITEGGCSSRADIPYQCFISRWTNTDFINLGFSSGALGEETMAEYLASLDVSVFVCDYDHNAPNPEHLWKTHERLFRIFRKKQPDTPVIFMSKPDFDRDPTAPERRAAVKATYDKAVSEGDKNVYFVDGERLFGKTDRECCTVDITHPNDIGFLRMAETLYEELKKTGVL